MIYTSYFDNIKNLPDNFFPVAICGKITNGYKGLRYKKLAPKYDFWKIWKETKDNEYYEKMYNETVLDKLDILEVLGDLYDIVEPTLSKEMIDYVNMCNCPWWANPEFHIVLVCYEEPGLFCHRHLVSKWLSTYCRCVEYKNNDS